jgi:hypothetical protein
VKPGVFVMLSKSGDIYIPVGEQLEQQLHRFNELTGECTLSSFPQTAAKTRLQTTTTLPIQYNNLFTENSAQK